MPTYTNFASQVCSGLYEVKGKNQNQNQQNQPAVSDYDDDDNNDDSDSDNDSLQFVCAGGKITVEAIQFWLRLITSFRDPRKTVRNSIGNMKGE